MRREYPFTFVYAFRCVGLIKFGWSHDPIERVTLAINEVPALRGSAGELLAAAIGSRELEQAILRALAPHAALQAHRYRTSPREWFHDTPPVRSVVHALSHAARNGSPMTAADVQESLFDCHYVV